MMKMMIAPQTFMIVQVYVMEMLLYKPIGTIMMVMVWVEKPAIISVPLMFHSDGYSIMMMKMMLVTPIIMTVLEYVMGLLK